MQEESNANCIRTYTSEAATTEILRLRDETGVPRNEIIRRVERWDPKFSQAQFWRIQNGKAQWTLDRFVFVAAALGLDPPMLLDRILRGHDIMEMLARDGPADNDTGPDGQELPG